MSRTLQFKRYANTVIASSITGANGEIIVDDTNYTLTVHDGQTLGGTRIATENYVINYTNAIAILANSDLALTQYAANQANSASSNTVVTQGVDATQNTNIQSAFNQANSANVLAQSGYNQANTAAQTEPQNAQSTTYILQSSDAGKHIYYTNASAVNLYIPWTANTTFANGTHIKIISHSSSNVIVTPNSGVSLYNAGNTTSGNHNVTTYGVATLQMVAANTWYIYGNGVV